MTALGVIVGFGIAAAVGTVLRWRISTALGPGGTLLINLSGAFVLGLLAGTGDAAMTILGTAGLGALTTVSGILPEAVRLTRASGLLALGYVSLTITGATAAAAAGLALS
ncbi:MAG: CrcB family protein [Acidimicrobiaceae bacterium]|nr:CrcB family protein [Acidimicrobiaceae bacterium]